MSSPRTLVSTLLLLHAVPAMLSAQPVDSMSSVRRSGGEASGIVYHRYRDPADLSAAASAAVWKIVVSDGDPLFGDADGYPTIIDLLRIGVELVGAPTGTVATRSIVWAGIYSIESSPRLLSIARVTADSLLFQGIAGDGIVALDNESAGFELRLKFVDTAFVGDRFRFSIATGDAVSASVGSSRIGITSVTRSRTGGDLNRILTSGLRLRLSSAFPDSAAPGERFGGALSIVDSAENSARTLSDSMRVVSRTEAGELAGRLVVGDSGGVFLFDSLHYSFRNDSAVFSFLYPGADTLSIVMLFTGGAATVPTVSHLREEQRLREIDGTGIAVDSRNLDGVFLFERFDTAAVSSASLPTGVTTVLGRHFRMTHLSGEGVRGDFLLGLPVDSLGTGAHPASIRLMRRDSSRSEWSAPARTAESYHDGRVYATFDSTGEFALAINSDRAVPVTGLTLQGEGIAGARARLRWRTISEIGNAGFLLRRASERNGSYLTVDSYRRNHMLEGAGTSATGASYTWIDDDPLLSGWKSAWYLLVEVSFDGVESIHGPIQVPILAQEHGTTALESEARPNPCVSMTTLSVGGAARGPATLALYDAGGKAVWSLELEIDGAAEQAIIIPMNDLPAGTYLYRLQSAGAETSGTIISLGR